LNLKGLNWLASVKLTLPLGAEPRIIYGNGMCGRVYALGYIL
jgi:hypothetical protein